MAPGSIMPSYPSLFENEIDKGSTMSKIHAMRKLGVPYPDGYEAIANEDMEMQASQMALKLEQENKIKIASDKEILALIAYMQRLGKDIKIQEAKLN